MAQQEEKMSPFARMKVFLKDVQSEMKKVAWPSKEEIKSSTSIVLLLLVILGFVVAVMDFSFKTAVLLLMNLA
jgi:preprotein translocase subunit SecE